MSRRRNLNRDLIELHARHPRWTALQLAAELQCGTAYVRKTAYREGLCLRSIRPTKAYRPITAKPKPMLLLPVPIRGLREWNARIAAR